MNKRKKRVRKYYKNFKKTNFVLLNKILNKYPYLPFILGFSLLGILIIDLVNYYK